MEGYSKVYNKCWIIGIPLGLNQEKQSMPKDKSEYEIEIDALGQVLTSLHDLTPEQQKFVLQTASGRLGIDVPSP